jgi:hypothetical protein
MKMERRMLTNQITKTSIQANDYNFPSNNNFSNYKDK